MSQGAKEPGARSPLIANCKGPGASTASAKAKSSVALMAAFRCRFIDPPTSDFFANRQEIYIYIYIYCLSNARIVLTADVATDLAKISAG